MMLTCEYCVKLKACSAKTIGKDCEKNPEYEGERFCPDFKKVLTNADHIRAMNDDELANWLDCEFGKVNWCDVDRMRAEDCSDIDCTGCITYWLKQPYKEKEE